MLTLNQIKRIFGLGKPPSAAEDGRLTEIVQVHKAPGYPCRL